MKYIRSKYGKCLISMKGYEYTGEDETAFLFKKIYKRKHKESITRMTKKICTIADTIEELCDTFIAIAENGTICAYDTFEKLKHYECVGSIERKCSFFKEKYGAIHIKDKGLIYVAKMNEKGELELLWQIH